MIFLIKLFSTITFLRKYILIQTENIFIISPIAISFKAIIFLIILCYFTDIRTLKGMATVSTVQSGNWSDGATWNTGSVPASTDDVVIQSGFDVTVDGNNTCASITVTAPSGTGTSTLTINTGVTLTVTGGVTLNGGSSNTRDADMVLSGTGIITIGGAFTINSATAQRCLVDMSAGASKINFAGGFTLNTAVNWSAGTSSTVNFNGSSAQTFPAATGIQFNHVTINNTSGVTVDANITNQIGGNLKVQTGLLSNGGFSIGGAVADSFEVANGATFKLTGTSTFPTGFGTEVLGTTSTIQYDGNGSQTIKAINYGNLTSSNSGSRTLPSSGTVGIAGTFTSGSNSYTITGSTINYNGTGSQNITAFNYNNLTSSSTGSRTLPSGSAVRLAGTFTPGTNTYINTGSIIEFNGTASQTIPAFNYYDLTSSSSGSRTLASSGTIKVENAFTTGTNAYTITGSTIEFNGAGSQTIPAFNYNNLTSSSTGARVLASSGTVGIAATFTTGTNTYTTTGSTISYNGSSAQTVVSFNYNILTVSNSSTTLGAEIIVPGDFTLNGTLNGNGNTINARAKWVNNGTFTHGNGSVIFNGSSAQIIEGSSSTTFYNVTINNTAGVTLNKAATITNVFTLTSGKITTTSTNLLTFDVNASVSGGSASTFISGPTAKNTNSTTSFTFPIGKNNYYRELRITPSNTNATTFTAEYFDATYSNTTSLGAGLNKVSKKEYFQLDRNTGGPPKADANVTLSWGDSSYVNGSALADLRVARWNGTQWTDMGNTAYTGSGSSGTVTSTVVTSFSPFTLGSSTSNNLLPIKLLSFNAIPVSSGIEINWVTASELNNDFYTVERSEDGLNFNEIALIKGAGSSNIEIYYEIIDESPIYGTSYYRLKQTDFDGKYEYFEMVAVYFYEQNTLKIINTEFNNSDNTLKVHFISEEENWISATLINYSGQRIWSESIISQKGLNKSDIDISSITNGLYFIHLEAANGRVVTAKFVKIASF